MMRNACLGSGPEVPRTALLCLLERALVWRKWSTEDLTTLGVRVVDLRNTNSTVQNRSCQRFSTSSKQVTLYVWLYLGTRSVEHLVREPGTGKQMCPITETLHPSPVNSKPLIGPIGEKSRKVSVWQGMITWNLRV